MPDFPMQRTDPADFANRNWRRFVLFRVLFNARFYYPVLAVLFLDLGLTATEYTLLNFAWALAIVTVDLPAGVLADRVGRRPLIVAAAASMVVEMILLCIAPLHGGATLFLCCLANRILSGAAEGMANGADEALVFDSLAERGREKEWPLVLDQVLRWQSLGFVIAMLVGGAVYDPALLNRVFGAHLQQGTTLRFPLYLTLLSAGATFVVALGMRESDWRKTSASPLGCEPDARGVLSHLLTAGGWILRTPLALFVIAAGLVLDSIARLFLTFSSSYFRLIHLPSASYGLIGAALGGLGLAVSPVARRMVARISPAGNFACLAAILLAGLVGVAARWPVSGVVFAVPIMIAISAVSYQVSYYLNAAVDSHRRATVLSFKGLAFNLGYGFVSLAYAGALRALRGGGPEETFGRTLPWLPAWLGLTVALLVIGFWQHRALLGRAVMAGADAA
jgi:MFS family permease